MKQIPFLSRNLFFVSFVFFKYQIDVGVGDETAEITFGQPTGQSRSVKEDESLADFLLGQGLDLFSVWDQFLDDVRICDRKKTGCDGCNGGSLLLALIKTQKDDDDINLEVCSCP